MASGLRRSRAQYGIAHESLKHDWMERRTSRDRRAARRATRRFTHVAVVHHETTTGRLNDLRPLGAAVPRARLRLAGGRRQQLRRRSDRFRRRSLDAVAATANKCLHGVPGASFVIVRRAALAQAASRTYYLDLGRLARLQDQRNTPFTPAVHAYYALVEALREFAERRRLARRVTRVCGAGRAGARGARRAAASTACCRRKQSSVVLRAYRLPDGTDVSALHDALKARGFVIYAGQGGLSGTLFRISTMGDHPRRRHRRDCSTGVRPHCCGARAHRRRLTSRRPPISETPPPCAFDHAAD